MENGMSAKVSFLIALNRVQGTIGPVHKDALNPHFRSKYSSLSSVNETIMGPLTEAGFVVMQGGADISGKPHLRTTLFHIDGHSESFEYPLICTDENPQKMASATSYARRYALCALLNLSTEDDDAESATNHKASVTPAVSVVFEQRKAADKAAVTQTGEMEVSKFIPSMVKFVDGKGKGAGKVFSEIYDGQTKYGGDEMQGQMAESAKSKGQVISVVFKRNGNYLNISRGGVKLEADIHNNNEEIEEIAF